MNLKFLRKFPHIPSCPKILVLQLPPEKEPEMKTVHYDQLELAQIAVFLSYFINFDWNF